MKIFACGNIDNNTVLEYKSPSNYGFKSSCSFSIQSDKADEFVSRYNKQSEMMSKCCAIFSGIGFLIGLCSGKKIVSSIVKAILGAFGGFIGSSFIAYKYNEKLMKKYDVKGVNL